MDVDQIQGLMGLLGVNQDDEQESKSLPPNAVAAERTAMGFQARSQAKPNMKVAVKQKPTKALVAAEKKKADDIWKENDFKENAGVVIKDDGDDRKVPDYDILFKQDVGSEDVFLNLGDRDGSSDHCHELVVKIKLPNAELRDISLDVLENRVICSSKAYKLNVALPHPVMKDDGNAKWDKLRGVLSVTLPIKTEVKYFSDVSDLIKEREN
eukprot:CAMPEP_0179003514 /NCGR_PEP_ID=MMETSP0795-20121207/12740_1 /TAXON_ID=88552 /ORGANISM="Amoebophrya sp., Strain Ameob2" /LENGTH=210 /DNA_ID=CAMNT_0020697571 /DNA_START=89 /DNA_END=721 /DNA_ORIENTATION=-